MKKTLLFSAILILGLMVAPSHAGYWVVAGGVTFDDKIGSPGAAFLVGQEYVVDKDLDIMVRVLYAKNNWGDTVLFNLDHFQAQVGKYWQISDKRNIRVAPHLSVDFYDWANNNIGGTAGGEIRGEIIPAIDLFIAGDAILRPGNNFFLIHCGFIFKM
jgi:hypothetical protein